MGRATGGAGRRAGFTLIELVVVVAILAVLAGVLTPIVSNEVDAARVSRAEVDLKSVENAFVAYRASTGYWPTNTGAPITANATEPLSGFSCLYADVWTHKGWRGPYLNDGFKSGTGAWTVAGPAAGDGLTDPWGRPYQVYWFKKASTMGAGGGIVVFSKGPDGVTDTSAANLAKGVATDDDVVRVVTRKL
ncbi:MAG TPA: prepilin-type N-terminal cleavage/methylation domain-containing protein [Planctomycetota bacterium]|nr:prepilin-type N-terminal cleavage/methylation domain-containing protein [Planctomycetota bacterium]